MQSSRTGLVGSRAPSIRTLHTLALCGASALAVACGSSSDSLGSSGVGGSATTAGTGGTLATTASGTTTSAGDTTTSSASGSGMAGSGGASTGSTTTSASSGTASSSSGSGGGAAVLWTPSASAPIHFHWMIGGFDAPADILPNQDGKVVYDIDGEGATAADVAAIHAAGAIAVCYVDVGTLEKGRSDYNQFPASLLGPVLPDWPNENWLLVTASNQVTILPLMKARFVKWCQAKGFDAIEPDNLDGWTNIGGITRADNLAYDLAIGALAHSLSMSIGLKNLATDLDTGDFQSFVSTFDWALNEQCYEYNECDVYTQANSFIPAGKAVFDVEYGTAPNCTNANQVHIDAQQTDLDLVGATSNGYVYKPCVPDNQTTW